MQIYRHAQERGGEGSGTMLVTDKIRHQSLKVHTQENNKFSHCSVSVPRRKHEQRAWELSNPQYTCTRESVV